MIPEGNPYCCYCCSCSCCCSPSSSFPVTYYFHRFRNPLRPKSINFQPSTAIKIKHFQSDGRYFCSVQNFCARIPSSASLDDLFVPFGGPLGKCGSLLTVSPQASRRVQKRESRNKNLSLLRYLLQSVFQTFQAAPKRPASTLPSWARWGHAKRLE